MLLAVMLSLLVLASIRLVHALDDDPGSGGAPAPQTGPTASFSNLTVSASATGPAMRGFPPNPPQVFMRWNCANIPDHTILQRDLYYEGELIRSIQDRWEDYWGWKGRVVDVITYKHLGGTPAGRYRLVIYLRDNPGVRVETTFDVAID
jgi:hypothetical protein